MNVPKLCIIVPCYNEDQIIRSTASKLFNILNSLISDNKIKKNSYLLLVDDGSVDQTWSSITQIVTGNKKTCRGIRLSRNFGHQKALLAGYQESSDADCVITIDADLQDDIAAINKMIGFYHSGFEIVYGVRNDRSSDPIFKRCTAHLFYKMMKNLGSDLIDNHADFRLMGKKSVKCLLNYNETNIFLRGLIPSLGFSYKIVKYKRQKRLSGKSKYSLPKMLSFAWEGVSSSNAKPLRIITVIGFMVLIFSLVVGIWTYVEVLIHKTVPGWGSLILSIYFVGGVQIFFIGIVGEYVAKIYSETKKRPRFIIEEKID